MVKKTAHRIKAASVISAFLLLASCASSPKTQSSGKNEDAVTDRQSSVETTYGDTSSSSDRNNNKSKGGASGTPAFDNTTSAKETAAERKARKQAEQLAQRQKKDPYTGWVYIPERNFSVTNGDIKLTLRGDTGSFGIYVIPEAGNPVPVLSTYDSFCSSFFSLKIGRKEYRLNRENGVKCEARRTPYGGQMAYTIENQAQLVVDFSFLPSIATSSRVDMLRVTVYTINLGKSTQSFTVKSVFDTVLGENAYTHFSTAAHSKIDVEKQYMEMDTEKWIRSYNESAAVQFLLDGKGITAPYCVTLANKDILSQNLWVPAVQEERSFSSVFSYNNSAVGINWNPAYLDPLKTDIISFYISVAADGNDPAGKEFLSALADGKTALSANPPASVETTSVPPVPASVSEDQLVTPYREGMPLIADGSEDEGLVNYDSYNSEAQQVQNNQSSSPVSSSTENTSSAGLPVDPEYVQQLLDRIQELQENPELADPLELQTLNDELDEILNLLRGTR